MITDKKSHIFSHMLLFATLLFVVCALIWANQAILDEVTVGQGKVIPSSQIQVIQNLEGGIVEKIYIHEGEIVQKDQILIQLDGTRYLASVKETEKKIALMQIEILRLTAEMNDVPLSIPSEFTKENPTLVEAEIALYKSRQQELLQLKSSLNYANKELEMTQPLVSKGAASEVEVLRIQREVNDLEGKIQLFKSSALEQLNKIKGELSALNESKLADLDRLKRTTVRSPVKGVINRLKATTIGGVIQPGMDIIEIVPLNDTLLIEAEIKPSDIGFISIGQDAKVKLTAYDFSIYGGLEGKVEQISADTITETRNGREESYYQIRVRTQKNYLGTKEKPLYIIPGMLATVDILTGHKSVLAYLLKPIIKARHDALRER